MSDNYITKEEILSFVEEMEKRTHGDDLITKTVLATTKCVKDFVMHMPSADVQPVVHGKWIPVDSYSAFGGDEATWMAHGNPVAFYYCSHCKEQAYAGEDGESLITEYCPNCGAKMNGKGTDHVD